MINFTKLLNVLFAILFTGTLMAQKSGTYTVGDNESDDYATIQEAVSDIAFGDDGVNGDVILELNGTEIAGRKAWSATAASIQFADLKDVNDPTIEYSLTVRPTADTESVVFNDGLSFGGLRRFTLDGRPGGEGEGVIIVRNEGTGDKGLTIQNTFDVTIKYVTVEMGDIRWGIHFNNDNGEGGLFGLGHKTVENCVITTSSTAYTADGAREYVRFLFNGGDIILRNNLMYGLSQSGTEGYKSSPWGVENIGVFVRVSTATFTDAENYTFENNVISLEKSLEKGTDAADFMGAIRINCATNPTVGSIYSFKHNTIILSGTDGAGSSYGIGRDYKNQTSMPETDIVMQNNLIVNSITGGGTNVGLWLTTTVDKPNMNVAEDNDGTTYDIGGNNIYTPGDNYIASWGKHQPGHEEGDPAVQTATLYSDIAAWNAFSGTGDTGEEPTFVNEDSDPPNYALDVDSETDTWIVGETTTVTADINGVDRGDEPTKGAYQFEEITLSIFDEVSAATDLVVYPNPVNDVAKIVMGAEVKGQIAVGVYDNTGKLVTVYDNLVQGDSQNYSLDVSTLKAGVYYIRVTDGNKRLTTPLIKK